MIGSILGERRSFWFYLVLYHDISYDVTRQLALPTAHRREIERDVLLRRINQLYSQASRMSPTTRMYNLVGVPGAEQDPIGSSQFWGPF